MKVRVYKTSVHVSDVSFEYRHRSGSGYALEGFAGVTGVAKALKRLAGEPIRAHLEVVIDFQPPHDVVRREGRWYRCFSLTSDEQELFWRAFTEG